MEKINRILRGCCMALTAALMAGCAAYALLRAMGFGISPLPVYLSAVGVAALMQLARRNRVLTLVVTLAAAAGGAVLLFLNIGDVTRALAAAEGLNPDLSGWTRQALALGCGLSILSAALFSLMLRSPAAISLALVVEIAVLIISLAINEKLSLWIALPGIAASVLAFALPSEIRGEMRPVIALPAVLIALLALAFVPGQRTTWEPLENAANRIRSIVEDYVRFTEERVAFSINELGYDHAGMIGDNVVAMLGGSAKPVEDTFMRVVANRDVLLRGTIKRSYTGYSWVDDQSKARYLYYDFTHASVREKVFDADRKTPEGVFLSVNAEVEMLAEGTSTLFVPAQMQEFSMGLADAVYYNSTGEVFLTRSVRPGDRYSISSRVPGSMEKLVEYSKQVENEPDARYNDAMLNYTHLPEGIDSRVYALAVELTGSSTNAAEKACAIQEYLADNYKYTLDGGYPPAGGDFVSWFLLESKEGYCSYFASAMTVMCRIAGIPARYVEGYYVSPVNGEAIITGKNAHAWVEVYLSGIGWTAFDPTARAVGLNSDQENDQDHAPNENSGLDSEDQQDPGQDAPHDGENMPDNEPTPSPTPDTGNSDNPFADGENDPTPPPPESENDPSPQDGESEPEDQDQPDPERKKDGKKKLAWLWILIIAIVLAALIALAVLYIRRRLAATDPLNMIQGKKTALAAALILYRANLTLLSRMGHAPLNGETPAAFARRATAAVPNEAYPEFVNDVVTSRYSGKPIAKKTVDLGVQAYTAFLGGMGRMERLKYHLGRMLRGIGDTENIP
ncbi:MAG: hypothetical protein IJA26_00385 [Clostridia bacterium]|nr:hypothetical protein [Clostridia bacterium]